MSTLLFVLLLSGTTGAQAASDADAESPIPATQAEDISAPASPSGKVPVTHENTEADEARPPASAEPQPSPGGAETDKIPATQLPELSPEARARRDELRRCLAY